MIDSMFDHCHQIVYTCKEFRRPLLPHEVEESDVSDVMLLARIELSTNWSPRGIGFCRVTVEAGGTVDRYEFVWFDHTEAKSKIIEASSFFESCCGLVANGPDVYPLPTAN